MTTSSCFELQPGLFSSRLISGSSQLNYRSQLFSLSGELHDNKGILLARIQRKGWWSLRFEITAENKKYQLYKKSGCFYLTTNDQSPLTAYNGADFFNSSNQAVCTLNKCNMIGKRYQIQIHC